MFHFMTHILELTFFGGKILISHDRALQTEQKSVLHQSPNFSKSKVMGLFVVKKVFNFA